MADTVGSIPLGAAPKGVVDPTLALQQAQLQRRLALAQMLQQSAQEAGGAYSSLNGMRVVPRMGIAPAISQIADTLLGSYEQKKAYGDQAGLAQQQMALQQRQAADAYGGDSQGSNPNIGLTPTAFAAWLRQDPASAYKFAAEHQALTDTNRQYVQQGRDLNSVGQLGQAADVVKGTQTFQPGTTNIVPGASQPFVAADFGKGTTGGYDQQGNPVLAPIQGAQSTLANLAGAQQAATSANTILPSVTMSDGSVRPAWAGQAAGGGLGGGGQSPGPSRAAPDPMNDILTQAKQMQAWGMPDDQIQAFIKQKAGATPGMTVDPGNGTPVDANGKPTSQLPAPVPVASGPVGIGQSTMDKALSEKRAGNVADMEQDITDKASSAQAKLANNAKIQALVPQITTGPFAGNMTKAKSVLNSLGWTGADPTNNQEFEKYAMQAALESAKQVYGNRITNADLMSLPHWNPSDSMTTNALNAIIDSDNIKQGRLLQRQNVYNEYRNQGGDLNQFSSYYNKNYPEQGVSATSSLTPGAAPVVAKPAATSNGGWSAKRVN